MITAKAKPATVKSGIALNTNEYDQMARWLTCVATGFDAPWCGWDGLANSERCKSLHKFAFNDEWPSSWGLLGDFECARSHSLYDALSLCLSKHIFHRALSGHPSRCGVKRKLEINCLSRAGLNWTGSILRECERSGGFRPLLALA